MWKKEDGKTQEAPEMSAGPASSIAASSSGSSSSAGTSAPLPVSPRAVACISQGIKIRGEVTGSEDLFVDGHVDGKLNLSNGSVTIGPNGRVKADISAREVIVRGIVEGKITGRDKVQLWSTGKVAGEVQTERLSIEEGALLSGKVEAGKPTKTMEARASAGSTTAGAEKTSSAVSVKSGTAAD